MLGGFFRHGSNAVLGAAVAAFGVARAYGGGVSFGIGPGSLVARGSF